MGEKKVFCFFKRIKRMLHLDLEDLDLVPNSAFAVIISQPS